MFMNKIFNKQNKKIEDIVLNLVWKTYTLTLRVQYIK